MNHITDKYKPKKLLDIIGQEEIIKSLNYIKERKNMPNLLFYGYPGTGKTSTIIALSMELFGTNYKDRLIEINASDERGISIIKEKIKKYSQEIPNNSSNDIPWKIIIIDEADMMTIESQYMLSRIMEEHINVTRFCIICNHINKIIDQIISRTSIYRFNKISKNLIFDKLKQISLEENIQITDDDLNKITDISNGDISYSLSILENKYINNQLYIPDTIFNKIIKNKNINQRCKMAKYIYNNGFSVLALINSFHKYSLSLTNVNERLELQKILIEEYGSIGSNEEISIYRILTFNTIDD
jgi:DNA polymerase III delta prime subunit